MPRVNIDYGNPESDIEVAEVEKLGRPVRTNHFKSVSDHARKKHSVVPKKRRDKKQIIAAQNALLRAGDVSTVAYPLLKIGRRP